MQATIGNRLLSTLKPDTKPYEVRDIRLKGFILRVQPSGTMSYICEYTRGKRITLGPASTLTPVQARDQAKAILGDVARGIDPAVARKAAKAESFGDFLSNEYGPWVQTHRKDGVATLARLRACFGDLNRKKLADINSWVVEKWRANRLKSGTKAATVNRDLVALKAALSKAVEWGLLDTHPLDKVKPSKVDQSPKVRFLDQAEEQRLREALDAREEKLRAERDSANNWRRARSYDLLPDLRDHPFADHLKPMVLLSLNTGLRRGELFSLTWENVDEGRQSLAIIGETAKSGKTRHVPLNREALEVLQGWGRSSRTGGLVFPGKDGKRLDNVKTAWHGVLKAAAIDNFRWHDMRHHFASRLVMAGVDLNTVRELLGHGDIAMTLRYAHLAPEPGRLHINFFL